MNNHYLHKLFNPRSIAVFGASERTDAVGTQTFENLLKDHFEGDLYPVNPKHKKVQGVRAFASLEAVKNPVDLAVIATPAATVPGIIESCGKHGTRAVIVMSAGFREVGDSGKRLENRTLEIARHHGVRFIGPNCLGLIRPSLHLNATFSKGSALPGRVALVSQSGALCTAILDWAEVNGVGFSNVLSTGISADLDFGEILDYLISDPETDSILLYIEGIHDARQFMSALRTAARVKPIVVMKTGRHAAGSRAAISHTGALVGADDVFDAALKRAGVVRVKSFSNLFSAAKILSSNLRIKGDRLAIVTNGGGPGIMATDRLADYGLTLPELAPETLTQLNAVLPETWSHANPVDIIGDATPERYREAVSICKEADNIDAVLAILTPQAMTRPEAVAQELISLNGNSKTPLLTAWMGETQVNAGRALFREHKLPTFRTPDAAVEGFHYLSAYYHNQQLLLQVPNPLGRNEPPDVDGARMIIEDALAQGRSVLNEIEAKALLSAFHVPVAKSLLARSAAEALLIAEEIRFPVVLKINSQDITHKSDVGGVRLNIGNARELRGAYDAILKNVKAKCPEAKLDGVVIEEMHHRPAGRELLIGVASDPVFGPVISFGMGGTAVEALADNAIALPPLNRFLVKELINNTRASRLLKAFRQLPPVDIEALENILLRISEIVCELPQLKEMDINPLIIDHQGAIAVDARMVVARRPAIAGAYDHMAIHPYPTHLISSWQQADDVEVTIRPIRPEDAQMEQAFVANLSSQSRYFRFMYTLRKLSPQMLSRLTQIDYDREMALVAIAAGAGGEKEIGVARYVINPDGESCEFAVVIADQWNGKGIATRLMATLIETAVQRRIRVMEGTVLRENHNMLRLMERLGFSVHMCPEDPQIVDVRRAL